MRQFLDDVGAVLIGIPIVLGMTVLYWTCRLFGYDLNDDF